MLDLILPAVWRVLDRASTRSTAPIALGPLGAYLLEWSLMRALLAALLTLLAREIAAQALWRGTLWAAQRV